LIAVRRVYRPVKEAARQPGRSVLFMYCMSIPGFIYPVRFDTQSALEHDDGSTFPGAAQNEKNSYQLISQLRPVTRMLVMAPWFSGKAPQFPECSRSDFRPEGKLIAVVVPKIRRYQACAFPVATGRSCRKQAWPPGPGAPILLHIGNN